MTIERVHLRQPELNLVIQGLGLSFLFGLGLR
jgi:hypothetical protein